MGLHFSPISHLWDARQKVVYVPLPIYLQYTFPPLSPTGSLSA